MKVSLQEIRGDLALVNQHLDRPWHDRAGDLIGQLRSRVDLIDERVQRFSVNSRSPHPLTE